jgi:hypothetical protein
MPPASLDVNLIGRLAYDMPPAQVLSSIEEEKIRSILLMPIVNG